jgi:hypothetical protein
LRNIQSPTIMHFVNFALRSLYPSCLHPPFVTFLQAPAVYLGDWSTGDEYWAWREPKCHSLFVLINSKINLKLFIAVAKRKWQR